MRAALTPEERIVWRLLRHGELAALNFRRQAPFDRYILDFVSHPARLVVEVDGAHHSEPDHAAHDAMRTAFLKSQGYRVLRVWNHEARFDQDGVWLTILSAAMQTRARTRIENWRSGAHRVARPGVVSPSMGEEASRSEAGGGETRDVETGNNGGAPQSPAPATRGAQD